MAMDQEMYSLTSQNYSDNLKSMMNELLTNDEFSDVTLVTDDKKHLKGHMNILCASSPVFRDILQKEKKSNPIIFMRGTHSSEVEPILQYIYLGEATFHQERMTEFLAVAKLLEIKGLCNNENQTIDDPDEETNLSETVTSAEKLEEKNVLINFFDDL